MHAGETLGVVALAAVVVREAFAMLRWMQTRRNSRNGNPGGHSSPETGARFDGIGRRLDTLDAELLRLRERQYELANDVTSMKGQWEMWLREHR